MSTNQHDPEARHPAVRRAVVWCAPTYVVALIALVGSLTSLVAAEPLGMSLACFAVTVVAGTGGLRARAEFRRGWRQGYESAIRTLLEHQSGEIPRIEVRAAVHGDPTPEPWDEHVPVLRPRSRL